MSICGFHKKLTTTITRTRPKAFRSTWILLQIPLDHCMCNCNTCARPLDGIWYRVQPSAPRLAWSAKIMGRGVENAETGTQSHPGGKGVFEAGKTIGVC